MKKKLFLMLMALTVVATPLVMPQNVSAATNLTDSVGSDATNPSAGSDATQGKKTEYESETIRETTYSGSNRVDVYATKAGYATVSIPKTIILGPTADNKEKYAGTFNVAIQGDIAGAQSITVTPDPSCSLVEIGGKGTVGANVTLNDKSSITVGASDLLNGNVYNAVGKISALGVSSGVWKTNINLGVVINYGE